MESEGHEPLEGEPRRISYSSVSSHSPKVRNSGSLGGRQALEIAAKVVQIALGLDTSEQEPRASVRVGVGVRRGGRGEVGEGREGARVGGSEGGGGTFRAE